MAHLIEADDIHTAWQSLLEIINWKGSQASPRGQQTKELLNVTVSVQNALENIIDNPIRDLNYRFMIAEWLWIMCGFDQLHLLTKYNSLMEKFSDDGQVLSGAYGPRLSSQWDYITRSLKDEASRQAVATIWNPVPPASKDIPCTISVQYLLRNQRLHGVVNMRSSDAWLGLPYDYFTFSQLLSNVARMMYVGVGSLTFNLASSHLYSQHWGDALSAAKVAGRSLKSPMLPSFLKPPSPAKVEKMLKGEANHLDYSYPFNHYASALLKNKIHALEVLRELDATIS